MTYSYTELRTNIPGNVVSEIYVSKMDNMKSPSHGPALGIGMFLSNRYEIFLCRKHIVFVYVGQDCK